MSLSKERNLSHSALKSAIKAFKSWRKNREKLCQIPDHLWQLAANLSTQYHYPLNTICRELGLNWGALKKKIIQLSSPIPNHPHPHADADADVDKVHPEHTRKPPCSSPFIELKLNHQEPPLLFNHSHPPQPPHPSPCAVELTKPDGTVMKIFASDERPLNLMELCKTFLG